ncbi:MAG: N-acetylmuramoyl-L-alanine amidase [Lachnospiraceae bacterium]|nr:N-acetylmuramoyl-L-alanine amidase [Lachnospiraceae bacterium]
MAKVILDAGHGGAEPGAIYGDRREKDDNLRLALAVGDILEDNGVEVAYTRTEDVYDTPLQKAQIANEEGGDFFVSFHRNSSPEANQYSGVETLVYDLTGDKVSLAEAINAELAEIGFRDLGVKERPDLIVLKRTQMPAVLVEVGFLNTDADNRLFDEEFPAVAEAIAGGILSTLEAMGYAGSAGTYGTTSSNEDVGVSGSGNTFAIDSDSGNMAVGDTGSDRNDAGSYRNPSPRLYRVQVGAYRNRAYAEDLLYRLQQQNYPAFLLFDDGLYQVQVGAFAQLENAIQMEAALRRAGYSTFITAE